MTFKTSEAAASPRESAPCQGSPGRKTGPVSRPAASGGSQQQLDFRAINKRLWDENVYLRTRVKSLGVTVRNLRRLLKTKGRHA